MTKSTRSDSSPSIFATTILEQMKPEAILESYGKWIRQVEEIHRALVGSAQQTQGAGWELAKQLSVCTDPGEMLRLCSEWMNTRREAFFDDGKRLSELMLRLWEVEVASAAAGETPAQSGRATLAAVQRSAAAGE
jgi:hypothetical protein